MRPIGRKYAAQIRQWEVCPFRPFCRGRHHGFNAVADGGTHPAEFQAPWYLDSRRRPRRLQAGECNRSRFSASNLVSVGRIAVEKNLEAFLSLDLPGTKVVIGEGPQEAELRRRFPDAKFLGLMEHKLLAAHLAAADAFVFPSRADTFGIVQLEALACGVPIAAFPVTGPRDVVGAKWMRLSANSTSFNLNLSRNASLSAFIPPAGRPPFAALARLAARAASVMRLGFCNFSLVCFPATLSLVHRFLLDAILLIALRTRRIKRATDPGYTDHRKPR